MNRSICKNLALLGAACLVACTLASCGLRAGRGQGSSEPVADAPDAGAAAVIEPAYAQGFKVTYGDGGVRLVDVSDPQNENARVYQFALVPRGTAAHAADIPQGYEVIETPVQSVICMTSLQLSNFIKLGATSKVVGITSTRHLFNSTLNEQLQSGLTSKIGIEGNFDSELIMSLAPDVIFISPFKRGGYDALSETSQHLVPHLGYKETTPLGQAEWVKFISMFTGQEAEANRLFAAIADRYNELCRLAASCAERRPVVFSGEMRQGGWYAVGGKSFLAQMFRDAGADYFLKDNAESGGVTLDYETVYSQAGEGADFWRIVNSFDGTFSYDALRALDQRYARFKAFRQRQVLYCNMRQKPFYESMPMEPDVVLEDLIYAFHPQLLPHHQPVYYEILR